MNVFVRSLVLVAVLGLAPALGASAEDVYHPALDARVFPVPAALGPNVEFWRAIFSRYSSTETLIHDNRDLDVVFAVVTVNDLVTSGASNIEIERAMRDRVDTAVNRYAQVLRSLSGTTVAGVDKDDARHVAGLYERSRRHSRDFAAAADRVRGQRGLADHFQHAIRISGQYMAGIERILTRHGVPREVRCLPFVESMFNDQARSKVGASGIWQFTRDTGRRYLRIDAAVDARHDVWLATDGAARLLRDNYARVSSWPLALTGYNHGITGMQRAARELGTVDLGQIAEGYQSRSFGFASRNFYAEFLAAVIVYADRARLFPGVTPQPAVAFDEFAPTRFVSLLDLAAITRTEVSTLVELNPALHPDVGRGQLLVPSGYPLRVPSGTRAAFQRAFMDLPTERTPLGQPHATHKVARGDTLQKIARRYGLTVSALTTVNGLSPSARLRTGQILQVGSGPALNPAVWTPPRTGAPSAVLETARVHIVRTGETLYQIAARYGLTVSVLIAANNRVSPERLLVGMELAIPLVGGR